MKQQKGHSIDRGKWQHLPSRMKLIIGLFLMAMFLPGKSFSQARSFPGNNNPIDYGEMAGLSGQDLIDNIENAQGALIKKEAPFSSTASQQPQRKELKGYVKDNKNQPLPGVSIVVKGTTTGTITDFDGNFSLTVPANAETLVFSFVGMVSQEIAIGNQATFNIVLQEESLGIDEVVVVGYGTQKKVNLTGAVDVISNEKLANRQASTVSQLLQGLSPGFSFQLDQDGFQPGAEMSISIRGIGSLNGGEPYILIDGFPGDINKLNPEDIESVSVLKDAAASAIYGARAPYGVILVTTKSGKTTEKLSATYSGNVFINTPQKLPKMLDSHTWTRVLNEAGVNRGGKPFTNATIDQIIAYQNEDWEFLKTIMPAGVTHFGAFPQGNMWNNANLNYANNDWYDIFYGHSVNQKHDFSLQGGTKQSTYYFSAGYLNQDGVINYGTDNFQRYNMMGKMKTEIASWWDFAWEARFSRTNRVRPNMTNQGDYSFIFHNIAKMYPITPIYDGWGNYHQSTSIPFLEKGGNDKFQETDHWQTFRTEIRPAKGWKVNADMAYNTFSLFRTDQERTVLIGQVDKTFTPHGTTVPNSIEQFHSDDNYLSANIFTSYEKSISNLHQFYLLVGAQYEKEQQRGMVGFKNNVIVEDIPSLQTATGSPILSESLNHRATTGYFSRFTYNYQEKYLLEANARYDGTSVFRQTRRWGFFPSFSLGWNVHKEGFWVPVEKYINTLKIRGSWGQLGNQNVAPYSDLELIPLQTGTLNWLFNFGETRPVGFTSTPGIVNRNLTWETATTKNIGVNMSFLKNRLQADFDAFERVTTNMIGPSEAKPGVLGANVPRDNNSTLRTTGWELAIRWKQDLANGFSYFLNANLYDNKSVVTRYYNPTGSLSTWYEGKEVGEIWGYTVNDLFRSAEEVTEYLAKKNLSFMGATWRPGDVKFEDTNGDDKVNNGTNTLSDPGDMSVIGNSSPRYHYGLTAGFNFKGFDFSTLWKGVAKRDLYFGHATQMFWGFSAWWYRSALTERNLDYFRDVPGDKYVGLFEGDANINTDAYWPRPYLNQVDMQKNLNRPNTRYLQSGAYVRMQNIQLGYTLPQKLVSKAQLQKVRLYFSGENLLTFSKLPTGSDPLAVEGFKELSGDDGLGKTYGADRIYSFGITVTY